MQKMLWLLFVFYLIFILSLIKNGAIEYFIEKFVTLHLVFLVVCAIVSRAYGDP